jgi:hypothetical protein
MKKAWEESFHEEFSPVWMKNVNGIAVVGAHWGFNDDHTKAMAKFFAEKGKTINPRLPFFYTQHDHPKDTCFGAWAWGHDDGTSTRVLSAFPNAVAFSGHSHYTLTDERTVWQGAFTSINTSSMKYSSHDYSCRENAPGNSSGYGGENREHAMNRIETGDGRQGMLVSVFDDRLEIERREFFYGEALGDNWLVPIPARADGPLSYSRRAAKRSAPEFAEDAKRLGCGLYVTGEASWGDVIAAENCGMEMICAGHYATETFGVKALARAMRAKLRVDTVFLPRATAVETEA